MKAADLERLIAESVDGGVRLTLAQARTAVMGLKRVEADPLPSDLTPANLNAYLMNEFGLCGCTELHELHASIVRLLEWLDADERPLFDTLYPEPGVFYWLAGHLDNLGLTEHGTSIRGGWLTDDGKRLLAALRQYGPDEIDEAEGTAYDGTWLG